MDHKQEDNFSQLEVPAQSNLRQLVGKHLLSGRKSRPTLLIIILLATLGGVYLLGVKPSKLDPQTIIPTNMQASPTSSISPTPLSTDELTPDRMVKLTETAKNPNWGDLKWIIIFTNAGELLLEEIKSDLCNGDGTNKLSYLPTWFKREANKYSVSLSISVKCYEQQIVLPQDVITTKDTYTAFGQAIPIPVDRDKTTKYLIKTIPSLLDYDLITVVHYIGSSARIADLAGVGNKVSYAFIAADPNLVDGVQYYAPNITQPNLDSDAGFIRGITHEALHSLRAQDHYDYNNFNCSDESNKSSNSLSIMCASNFTNFTDYFISPETAKEIGWTN